LDKHRPNPPHLAKLRFRNLDRGLKFESLFSLEPTIEMASHIDFEFFDHLYRSRKTLLRILADRGYNTKPFENFGPDEIEAMVIAGAEALRMDLERPKTADSNITKCRVVYSLTKLKSKLGSFLNNLLDKTNTDAVDPLTTEVIVMLAAPEGEPVVDMYHTASYEQLTKEKLRIFFFRIANLVIHPSDHVLVPKHEKLAEEEIPFPKAERYKLPFIRFHEDMQARILGLVPRDIVKITRPSPSSGVYTMYRICSP
jgi:DNA-directed RNA polymerase subunit H (RpoH/RPB5)